MMSDTRGEMGFAEAMLAVMAVSVVLMMYIGSVSTAVQLESDPLEGIDTDLLTAEVSDGRVTTDAGEVLEDFFLSSGARGLSLSIAVPGGLSPELPVLVLEYGTLDGSIHSRTFSKLIPADHGRTVVAVFGVSAWM